MAVLYGPESIAVQDSFNRPDESPAAGLWVPRGSANQMAVVSNRLTGSTAGAWNFSAAPSLGAYAPVGAFSTVVQTFNSVVIGFMAEGQTYAGYFIEVKSSNIVSVWRSDNTDATHVWTQLGADLTPTYTAGDAWGLTYDGSTLTVWQSPGAAGTWNSIGTRADSTFGNVGFFPMIGGWSTDQIHEDFGGGAVADAWIQSPGPTYGTPFLGPYSVPALRRPAPPRDNSRTTLTSGKSDPQPIPANRAKTGQAPWKGTPYERVAYRPPRDNSRTTLTSGKSDPQPVPSSRPPTAWQSGPFIGPYAKGFSRKWQTFDPVFNDLVDVGQPEEIDEALPITAIQTYPGITAAAGQATESDLAQPVGRSKALTPAQAAESDLAQPVGRSKALTPAQATEPDLAQPVGRSKALTPAQTTEPDLAHPVGRSKARTPAQATESDLAHPVSRSKARTPAQATESDLSQPVSRWKIKVLGQATESDLAQPVSRWKIKVLGQAAESDLAQPVVRKGILGQAFETDIAQPITRVKVKAVGQATETDSAQAHSKLRSYAAAQATEADTAQPVARRKVKALGQAAETDTAQHITLAKGAAVGLAAELDQAQAFGHLKRKAAGQPAETDTALPITAKRSRVLGQAAVADSAQAVTHYKVKQVGQVQEAESALDIAPRRGGYIPIGVATFGELHSQIGIPAPGNPGESVSAMEAAAHYTGDPGYAHGESGVGLDRLGQ